MILCLQVKYNTKTSTHQFLLINYPEVCISETLQTEVMLLKNINSLLLNLHFTCFAPYSLKMAFHYFAVDLDLQMRSHIWHTTPQIEQKSRRWNLQLKLTTDENLEV